MTPGAQKASKIAALLLVLVVQISVNILIHSWIAWFICMIVFWVVWIRIMMLNWTPDFSKLRMRQRGE